MPYGRIDVYWPDGPIESYPLEKGATAIGRSTGNDIVLDTTAISRYHITISVKDQKVFLEDLQSVNGTYVDGMRIASNDPLLLRGGEEIQIGDIRLIYHPAADLLSDASDTTQRIVLSQLTYRVEMEGPDMSVAPGAHVQAMIRIENLGDAADRYFVELEGLPKAWVRIDRLELEIDPGDMAQVIISFKPLRRSESAPGAYPFTVRVRSRSNPAQTIDAPATLHVLPFSGFGMALAPLEAADGRFNLYLHNQGNAPLTLALHGADAARRLRFQFPAGGTVLAPGERQTYPVAVRAQQRRWAGGERETEFAVMAQAQDASGFLAAVPGRLAERALLPTWAPVLIIPALAAIILIAAGLIRLVTRGDEPEPTPPAPAPAILSFTATSPSVMLGDIAQVSWQVSDAERGVLTVAGAGTQRQIEVRPGESPYALIFDRTGVFTVTLQAIQGDAAASASTTIEVLPDVMLSVQVEGEADLVRHVAREVRLTWEVTGAQPLEGGYAISIDSSDQGEPLFPAPLPLSGSEIVTVAPSSEEAEWLVTLLAQGDEGVTASVTQSLRIAEPACQLVAARTVVRSGPDELYSAVLPPLEASGGNLPPLQIVARAPQGGWLKVVLGAGEDARSGWVSQADLRCTNFDPARLAVDANFPPPPVQPTARPTATPRAATPTPAVPPTITAAPTRSPGGQ